MEKKQDRVSIYAVRSGSQGGFNIWVNDDGKEAFIAYHHRDPEVFQMLCGGISLTELHRACSGRLSRLCHVIDGALEDMRGHRRRRAGGPEKISA